MWECLIRWQVKSSMKKKLRTAKFAQKNDLKSKRYLGITNSTINYSRDQLLQIYNMHTDM